MTGPRIETLAARLEAIGVLPVVTVTEPLQAVRLAEALLAGGIDAMEVTFHTEAAAEAIRLVCHHCPEMLVAAGTVLRNDQVDAAWRAGAAFAVSPGINNRVVRRCKHLQMPLIPGVATPSEIQWALDLGFTVLKFFPASALGGAAALRTLAGPFPMARFVPTGGVDVGNLGAYLALPTVVACGGSWLVPDEAVRAGDYPRIRSLVAETVAVLAKVRGTERDEAKGAEPLAKIATEIVEQEGPAAATVTSRPDTMTNQSSEPADRPKADPGSQG